MLTLQWLIALIFASLTSLLIAGVGAVVHDEGSRRIETTSAAQLAELSRMLAVSLDRHVRQRAGFLLALGDNIVADAPDQRAAALRQVRHFLPDISLIGLAARDATLLVADPPAQAGHRFNVGDDNPGTERIALNAFPGDGARLPALTYWLPLRSDGAVMVAQIDWDVMRYLDDLVVRDRRAADGLTILMLAGGAVLDATGKTLIEAQADASARATIAALGDGVQRISWSGHRHIAVRAALPERVDRAPIALSLVVMQDTENALRPVEELRQRILAVGLCLVVLAAGVGWLLASWIAAPLHRLAVAVGSDDATVAGKLPQSSRYAEIGALSSALTRLLERVTEEAARRATAFQAALDAVVVIDEHDRIEAFNAAAERMFGFSAGEAIGADATLLLPLPHNGTREGSLRRLVAAGEPGAADTGRIFMANRRDGSTFPCRLTVGESRLADGRRVFTAFVRDISKARDAHRRLQQARAELHQMHRLVSVGQVGTQLAHEINQPLGAIANYAAAARQLLAGDAEPSRPRLDSILGKIVTQTNRASEIVRRLRRFVSKPSAERLPHDVNALVERSLDLTVAGPAFEHVWVVTRLAPDLAPVRLDRVEIEQVLTNLIANAVEAMAHMNPAVLEIRTRREADAIVVDIADRGPGIDPAVAARLFMPFMTSKPGGLGLGLSICRAIVDAHEGRLSAAPNPGGGTIFTLELPVDGAHDDTV
jgi:two-component system, LuxR family, sensor kinase FixL